MTERSRPWDGTTTGDATDAPYDASTEWAELFRAILPRSESSANKGGVVLGATGFSDYNATTPGANTARIASGIGWDYGQWHRSDANVDFTISTPAVSTRVDRIVLRKSWSLQTVRLTRIAGTEGAGAPALTQTAGTTWDVPLWLVSITTGGAITFTDQRYNLSGVGSIRLASAAYTIVGDDMGGLVVQSSTNTVTLPAANSMPIGSEITVKATTTGATVIRSGSDTIWGSQSGQTVFWLAPGDAYRFKTDGTSIWYVVSNIPAMVKLNEQAVSGSPQANFDFTSAHIPTAGFRHLNIKIKGRSSAAVTTANAIATVNGDTGNNYDRELIQAAAGTISSTENIAGANAIVGDVGGSSSGANVASQIDLLIEDFLNTAWQKSFRSQTAHKALASSGNVYVEDHAGFWRSTAAITAVRVALSSGSWEVGSVATLYGIV